MVACPGRTDGPCDPWPATSPGRTTPSHSSSRTGRPPTSSRPPRCPRVEASEPEFPEWFAAKTQDLLTQCRTVPPTAVCWAPHPLLAGTGAYWTRRIAYDTLVHRWDAEAGAGIAGPAMEPDIAADAVDEVLDVGLRVTRAVADSPAGPAIRLACTDAHQAWHLDLAEVGLLRCQTRRNGSPNRLHPRSR